MNRTVISISLFAACLIFAGFCAYAQMSEEAKIEHLINYTGNMPAGTKFIRNGSEYDSEKAAKHLRAKYNNGKKYAKTAELFIENIASKSSITGIEYSIKFADGRIIPAHEFFTEELKKLEP